MLKISVNKLVISSFIALLATLARPNTTKFFFLDDVEDLMNLVSLVLLLDGYSHFLRKKELLLSIYE